MYLRGPPSTFLFKLLTGALYPMIDSSATKLFKLEIYDKAAAPVAKFGACEPPNPVQFPQIALYCCAEKFAL